MSSPSLPLPRPHHLTATWGHHAGRVLALCVLGVVALRVVPAGGPVPLLAGLALAALTLTSWQMLRAHDRRLCEACLHAMPLDPAGTAARRRRRFATVHAGSDPWKVLAYLAVLVGSNFLPGRVGVVVWALVQSSMIYLVLAYSTHRTLQPWCPWCRGGGGGSDEVTPVDDGPRPHRHPQPV